MYEGGKKEDETIEANNKIKEQFYGNDKTDNSHPFHVDINNKKEKGAYFVFNCIK